MEFNLEDTLQALLFTTSEPLSVKELQAVIARFHEQDAEAEESPTEPQQGVLTPIVTQVPALVTGTQIREALDKLARKLEGTGNVYRLVETATGYRLALAPELSLWGRLLRGQARPRRLSPALLETLAIIAYRQPVTRAEIEAIRGVAADNALQRLLERELIASVGRADLPGRPIQYGTTEAFLELCGLRSLDELPASDALSSSNLRALLEQAAHPPPTPTAEDVGLPSGQENASKDPDADDGRATEGAAQAD